MAGDEPLVYLNLSLTLAKVSFTARYVPAYRFKHIIYKKLRIQDIAKVYIKEVQAIPHMNEFMYVLAKKMKKRNIFKSFGMSAMAIAMMMSTGNIVNPVMAAETGAITINATTGSSLAD